MWNGESQMQYNGKFINPYEVLGLPHASDFELVKATYVNQSYKA